MYPFVFTLARDDPAAAVGSIVAATPGTAGSYRRLLSKGNVLQQGDLEALRALAVEQPGLRLTLLRLEEGDVDENTAALRLGEAVAGPGVELRGPSHGRLRLAARHNGLLMIDAPRLAALNAVPDVSVYTIFGYTPVARGTVVAEAKITPLAAPAAVIARAEALARGDAPLLDVVGFQPRTAGLLIRERLDPPMAEKIAGVLRGKLSWFGSRLLSDGMAAAPPDCNAVAGLLSSFLGRGADLLLTTGASASDPLDPTLQALAMIGAAPPRVGVPVHPGSLLWIAWKGDVPILGIPSCGAISEHTSFDILLPRLLALGRGGLRGIESLAEGGLLTRGMEHRFPPYDSH